MKYSFVTAFSMIVSPSAPSAQWADSVCDWRNSSTTSSYCAAAALCFLSRQLKGANVICSGWWLSVIEEARRWGGWEVQGVWRRLKRLILFASAPPSYSLWASTSITHTRDLNQNVLRSTPPVFLSDISPPINQCPPSCDLALPFSGPSSFTSTRWT